MSRKLPPESSSKSSPRRKRQHLPKPTPTPEDIAQKKLAQKTRKARNQRLYYERHKAEEQAKARVRATKARAEQRAIDKVTACPVSPPPCPDTVSSSLDHQPLAPAAYFLPDPKQYIQDPLAPPCTLEQVFEQEWGYWSSKRRMVAIRRWLFDLEWEWGPVSRWASSFGLESARMKKDMMTAFGPWMNTALDKVKTGRLLLGYVSRVMEGAISDVEECRDLYLQGVQQTHIVLTAVTELEAKITLFKDTLIDMD